MAPPIKKKNVLTKREEGVLFILAGTGATYDELCEAFQMPKTTLIRRYGPAIKSGKFKFKRTLRQEMIKTAFGTDAKFDDKGNVLQESRKPHPSMQIFLSKNLLGMSDKVDFKGGDRKRNRIKWKIK